MTLAELIDAYQLETYRFFKKNDANGLAINQYFIFDNHQDYLDKYLNAYRNLDNLTDLVIYAVNGFFKLNRDGVDFFIQHGHQQQWKDDDGNLHGINNEILREVRDNLVRNIDAIRAVRDFEEIIEIVNGAKTKGFGATSIYDTGLRIGSHFRIEPTKVYLHTGAKKGCLELERKGYLPTGTSEQHSVPMEIMPLELRSFKPYYLEHFFCAAKKRLAQMDPKLLD